MFASMVVLCLTSTWLPGSAQAASVTDWGGGRHNTLADKLVGRWILVGIFDDNQEISTEEQLTDYWIFKSNGIVEHREYPKSIRRSNYYIDGRNLIVTDRRDRSTREFFIKYITSHKLIWINRQEDGNTITYNFERY